ncbi:dihydrolipoyl dehydrogenase [Sphingomonas yunnanensis]|uniref:dihydrolipoyl dehydrogenase n=1 Tax=Sphingomonas yunnanensis TaxID=310400 RepID=UPI001CA65696|nr:dihydrolipoyl dehydrogenase [Sphingomonas yunnanensis]MBY9063887.1 dihydrolipoyl dehydrogenase [Sphingomonas yunnanensis]
MDPRDCDVLILGAGTAGLKAYKAATARGADTLIVERGPGGSTCTRVGCMPSKLLIAAGRAAHQARGAAAFGVDTGAVTVDAARVWQRVRAERDRFVRAVLDEYHAIPADRVVHGTARFCAADAVMVGDRRVTARRGIVIATGGHPIVPELLEPVRHLVHTHETIFDLDTLPRALAVIGAGPLGLELGQAFARLDVDVTVIDDGQNVGGLKDPEVNRAAVAALGREMTLALGVEAEVSATDDGRARLTWDGGDAIVDLILAATGRPPSLAELALETTGVALDEHGTPEFDARSHRCGDSAIFVAGDAGAWRPVLHEAARGGRIAGDVAAGGKPQRRLPAFAVAFTEPNLVSVGRDFDSLPENAQVGAARVSDNGRATADGEDQGLVRLYGDADGRLIGAAIAAPGGEHLGHLVALAIDRGTDVATFADQAWYHPTVEELLQAAARDLLGVAD